jgi:NifU-like protein involved in Fe-S cluster formation
MQTQELLHRIRSLRYNHELANATYTARALNASCGDDISLHIKCSADGIVEAASFSGHGCALCLVSADDWCAKAHGQKKGRLVGVGEQTVTDRLGFDPGPLRSRCAALIIEAWKKIETIWEV